MARRLWTHDELVGKTKEVIIRQRVNQNVCRTMILNNYNDQCAITGISDSRLLIASHIIPWAERGNCFSPTSPISLYLKLADL